MTAPHLSDAEQARQWRKNMGLSRDQLAELSGYSRAMIQIFEAGQHPQTGKPIRPSEWKKYKLICAAIIKQLAPAW